jgi:hypothetical protein
MKESVHGLFSKKLWKLINGTIRWSFMVLYVFYHPIVFREQTVSISSSITEEYCWWLRIRFVYHIITQTETHKIDTWQIHREHCRPILSLIMRINPYDVHISLLYGFRNTNLRFEVDSLDNHL